MIAWGAEVPVVEISADAGFELALANADSIAAWIGCESQWRRQLRLDGHWIWLGLDYPGVDVVLRRLDLEDPNAVFADLQLMEREALATFNEIA